MSMITELHRGHIVQQSLNEAFHFYAHDAPQRSMFSVDFSEAGRLFEAAIIRALEVFKGYIPLDFSVNHPMGAIWDIHFGGGEWWSPHLRGYRANLKGANVEVISTIGALEKFLPFQQRNRAFKQKDGRFLVHNWLVSSGYNTLRLVKPATKEIESYFVRQVQLGNWRVSAKLLGEPHWKKTQLGHEYFIYFYPQPPHGLINSISVSREILRDVELQIRQDSLEQEQQPGLFSVQQHQYRSIYPTYADPKMVGKTKQQIGQIRAQEMTRFWHSTLHPQQESSEDDSRVFMRTKRHEGGHVWRLQSPDVVNESTTIITLEVSKILYNRLPVGSL